LEELPASPSRVSIRFKTQAVPRVGQERGHAFRFATSSLARSIA
jgi:hypothetical protein